MTTQAQATPGTAANKTDDIQICEMVKNMENGWAKKDGNLFAKSFAENADYVVINGRYLQGKMAIAKGHQEIFDSFYKETNIKTEVQSIRYIRPDVAIVHLSSHLTGTSNGQKIDGRSIIALTVEKSNGNWQIDAFQNTRLEEQPVHGSNN